MSLLIDESAVQGVKKSIDLTREQGDKTLAISEGRFDLPQFEPTPTPLPQSQKVKDAHRDVLFLEYPGWREQINVGLGKGFTHEEIRSELNRREMVELLEKGRSQADIDMEYGRDPSTKSALIRAQRENDRNAYRMIMEGTMTSAEADDLLSVAQVTGYSPSLLFSNKPLFEYAKKEAGRVGSFVEYVADGAYRIWSGAYAGRLSKDAAEAVWEHEDAAKSRTETTYDFTPDGVMIPRYKDENPETRNVRLIANARKEYQQFKNNLQWFERVEAGRERLRPVDSEIGAFLISVAENAGFSIMSGGVSGVSRVVGGALGGALGGPPGAAGGAAVSGAVASLFNTNTEAKMEGGAILMDKLRAYREQGMSIDDAFEKAAGEVAGAVTSVYRSNLGWLGVSNLVGDQVSFGLGGVAQKTAGRIAGKSLLARTARAVVQHGMSYAASGVTEGLEELGQEFIQKYARGEPITVEGLQDAFSGGAAQALVYTAVGQGIIGISGRLRQRGDAKSNKAADGADAAADIARKLASGELKPEDVVRNDEVVFVAKDALDRALLKLDEDVRGGIVQDFQLDEQTDHEVLLPKRDYELLVKQHPQLLNDIEADVRMGTHGVTAREAVEREARKLAVSMEDKLNADTPEATAAREAARELTEGLVQTGNQDAELSQMAGTFYGHSLLAQSKAYGMSVEQLHRARIVEAEQGAHSAGAETAAQRFNQSKTNADWLDAAERLNRDEAAFGDTVDRFVSRSQAGDNTTKLIQVMQTPMALQLAGARNLPIKTTRMSLHKILEKKHKLPPSVLKQLPRALADPIMVLKSPIDGSKNRNSFIVLLELKHEGSSVVAAIGLDVRSGEYTLNELKSVFPKDRSSRQQLSPEEDLVEYINRVDSGGKSLLKYINKEKSVRWSQSVRTGSRLGETLENSSLAQSVPTEANLVNALNANPGFYQGEGDPKGAISFAGRGGEALIQLFETADASTIFHELWHLGLDNLLVFGAMDGASDQAKSDRQAALEWLGIADLDLSRGSSRLSAEQRERYRDAQEKWAEGGEQFLKEGRAPIASLQGVFERIRQWMLELIDGLSGTVQLTDEVRDLYARIVATPQELDAEYDATTTLEEVKDQSAQVREALRYVQETPNDESLWQDDDRLIAEYEAEFGDDTFYQRAYHGSPHKFDKFSLEHMGKGEGAQAYGWGLYFAGDKEVAEWYREKLSNRLSSGTDSVSVIVDGENITHSFGLSAKENSYLVSALNAFSGAEFLDVKNDIVRWLAEPIYLSNNIDTNHPALRAADIVRQINTNGVSVVDSNGQLFEVEIPESDVLLDWDQPMISQSEQVKKILSETESLWGFIEEGTVLHQNLTGILDNLKEDIGASRTTGDSDSEDNFNFDYFLKILKKGSREWLTFANARLDGVLDNAVSEIEDFALQNRGKEGLHDSLRTKIENLIEEMRDAIKNHRNTIMETIEQDGLMGQDGEDFYKTLQDNFESDQKASEYLNSIGIPGIKYLDGSSRGKGEGHHNYVIFDDEAIDVLETFYQRKKDVSEAVDAEYFEAVNSGNMERAQEIVSELASQKGYVDDRASYRSNHKAPNSKMLDVSQRLTDAMNGEIIPKDFWTKPQNYLHGDDEYLAFNIIKRVLLSKKETMKMYRALPKDQKGGSFANEDWVTPLRDYAVGHGEVVFGKGKYRIIEQDVKVEDVWWNGDYILEFGYDDTGNYGYKNTKNNRKLLDAVVRDENGEIVPPSKRFDYKKVETFYQAGESDSAEDGALSAAQILEEIAANSELLLNTDSLLSDFGDAFVGELPAGIDSPDGTMTADALAKHFGFTDGQEFLRYLGDSADAVAAAAEEQLDVWDDLLARDEMAAARNESASSRPSVVRWIRENGGISYAAVKDVFGPEDAKLLFEKLGPGLFRKDGVGLDDIALLLQHEGVNLEGDNALFNLLMADDPDTTSHLEEAYRIGVEAGRQTMRTLVDGYKAIKEEMRAKIAERSDVSARERAENNRMLKAQEVKAAYRLKKQLDAAHQRQVRAEMAAAFKFREQQEKRQARNDFANMKSDEAYRHKYEREHERYKNRLQLEKKRRAYTNKKLEVRKLAKDMARMATSKGVFAPMRTKMQEILFEYDLKFRSKKTHEKRMRALEEFKRDPANAKRQYGEDFLKEAKSITLDHMTVEEVRELHARILAMHDEGATAWRVIQDANKERRSEFFRSLTEPLMGALPNGKKFYSGKGDLKKQYKGVAGTLEHVKDWAYANTLGGNRFFDWLDNGQGKYSGPFVQFFVDAVNRARDVEKRREFERKEAMERKMEELGISYEDLAKTRFVEGISEVGEKPVTLDVLLHVYAGMKNAKAREAILNGCFQDFEFPDEMAARCIAALSDNEKALADAVSADFDANFDRINEALERVFNVGMKKEDNYTPVAHLDVGHGEEDAPLGLLGLGGSVTAGMDGSVNRGFTKARVDISKDRQSGIVLGLLSTWNSQVTVQEHTAAFAQIAADQRAVMKMRPALSDVSEGLADRKATLKNLVSLKYGADAWSAIEDYQKIVAQNDGAIAQSMLDNTAAWLGRNMSIVYLCGNLGTVLKQVTSIPRFLIAVGPHKLLASVGRFAVNPDAFLKEVYAHDPQMKARKGDAMLAAIRNDPTWGSTRFQKALDMGLAPISAMDRWVAAIGWDAVYRDGIASGLSREGAIQEAQRMVALTQQTIHAKDMPRIWNQNGLARLAMIFTSDAAQVWGMGIYDFVQQSKSGQAQKALQTMLAVTVSAMLMRMVTQGLPDEDDDEGWTQWVASAFSEQAISSIPLIGKGVLSAWQQIMGESHFGIQPSAVDAPFISVIQGVGGLLDDREDNTEAAVWKLVTGLSILFGGAPITAAKRARDVIELGMNGEGVAALQRMIGMRMDMRAFR